jgi:CO dehydrogenase maturation factor
LKTAVSGKGGSGKTTFSATLSRVLARSGQSVLAIDADTNPNLATSLGVPREAREQALHVPRSIMERRRRDDGTQESVLLKPVDEIVEQYAVSAPDGVRLLQMDKVGHAGTG